MGISMGYWRARWCTSTFHGDVFAVEFEGVLFGSCEITRLYTNNEGNTYREMDKRMSHCISSVRNSLLPIPRSEEERHTSASPTKDERFRPLEYVLNHHRLPVIPIPYQFVFEEI